MTLLFLLHSTNLWITYKIKPEIFDEKCGNAALLIKNFRFYFIFNPLGHDAKSSRKAARRLIPS